MTDQIVENLSSAELLRMTAQVVTAYVSHNAVSHQDVSQVINTVHGSLADLNKDGGAEPPAPEPAVPVKRSITANYLLCLEDGKKLKMLKRHLRTAYNMSPEDYRAKWNLPSSYPMVAPAYARQRSEFAKKIGLGRSRPAAAAKRTRKKRR
jgi:predicted transcriptional regulator